MDKDRFNQIVNNIVEFKPKGIKRPWHTLTENERVDAQVLIKVKTGPKSCEDCGVEVKGRRCSIYNNRITGVKGKRSQEDCWVKYCHSCGKRWDYTGVKTKNTK